MSRGRLPSSSSSGVSAPGATPAGCARSSSPVRPAVRACPAAGPSGPAAAALPVPGTSEIAGATLRALAMPSSLLRLPPAAPRLDVVTEALDWAGSGDTLVLVPARRDAEVLARRLTALDRRVALQPEAWAEAAAGGCTVVGARASAFAPVGRLGLVVVLDAHSEAYVEERAPTWDATVLAAERARRAGVPCLQVSPCPTLVGLATSTLVTVAPETERDGWAALEVIDRRGDDPRSGLFSSRFAAIVRESRSVRPEVPVVCVLNRTGRARLLACGGVSRDRALRALRGGARRGGRRPRARLPGLWDKAAVRVRGLRVDAPEAPAARHRPRRRGARRARRRAGRRGSSTAGPRDDGGAAGVLLGTEAVLHRVRVASVVVFLDFDQELAAPRHRAWEEAFGLLAVAGRLVGGRGGGGGFHRTRGRVIVQTRIPDHVVLRSADAGDPGLLAAAEATRRASLGLPPDRALALIAGASAAATARRLACRSGRPRDRRARSRPVHGPGGGLAPPRRRTRPGRPAGRRGAGRGGPGPPVTRDGLQRFRARGVLEAVQGATADSEDELCRRLAGDLDAGFAELVATYGSLVCTVAARATFGNEETEDLAAEAFLRAYRALRGYDAARIRELRLRPWLVTIAVNVARNARRAASRHRGRTVSPSPANRWRGGGTSPSSPRRPTPRASSRSGSPPCRPSSASPWSSVTSPTCRCRRSPPSWRAPRERRDRTSPGASPPCAPRTARTAPAKRDPRAAAGDRSRTDEPVARRADRGPAGAARRPSAPGLCRPRRRPRLDRRRPDRPPPRRLDGVGNLRRRVRLAPRRRRLRRPGPRAVRTAGPAGRPPLAGPGGRRPHGERPAPRFRPHGPDAFRSRRARGDACDPRRRDPPVRVGGRGDRPAPRRPRRRVGARAQPRARPHPLPPGHPVGRLDRQLRGWSGDERGAFDGPKGSISTRSPSSPRRASTTWDRRRRRSSACRAAGTPARSRPATASASATLREAGSAGYRPCADCRPGLRRSA